MKFVSQNQTERGSALVVTLFITAALLIGIASYLLLVRAQYVSVTRSQAWNGALTMAESGVEEALAQLNPGALEKTILVDRTANGWGLPAGGLYGPISRSVTSNTSYSVVFSDGTWPKIYSTGYVRLPDISATLRRVVCVATTNVPMYNISLAARTNIDMSGNGVTADSFSSSSTNFSVNGRYSPLKASTNGDVAVLYGSLNLGNHSVSGDVYLGPTAIMNAGSNQVSGQVYHDFNYDFPDVVLPDTSGWFAPTIPIVGLLGVPVLAPDGNLYNYVFNTSGDYKIANLSGSIYVGTNASVRLLIQNGSVDNIKVAGNGAAIASRLTMYVSASTFGITGGGLIDGGRAANLAYYGLPSNTSITYNGGAGFVGTLYAPEADLTMTGGGSSDYNFVGCCIAKSVRFTGHFMFHFDEDLISSGASRGVFAVSWNEL